MKETLSVNNLKRSVYAPVRRKLFRDLFLLILSIFLIFLLFIYFFSEQMKKELAISVLDSTTTQIKSNFSASFTPVKTIIEVSRTWLKNNNINVTDTQKLNQRFIPLLETTPHISSVIIANSKGEQYFLLKKDQHWLVRLISKDIKKGAFQAKWSKLNEKSELIDSWVESTDYDMFNRPWYIGALANPTEFFITKPYLFYTEKVLGITISRVYESSNSSIKKIIAFDISINNMSRTVDNLKVGENGKAFIISSDGALLLPQIGSEIYQGSDHGGSINLSSKNKQHLMLYAIQNWKKNTTKKTQVLKFSVNGQRWWSYFFSLGTYGQTIQAGIIVPEHDYIHILEKKSTIFIPIIILLVIFSILAAWFIVKSNSKRQKELPKTAFFSNDFENELFDLLRRGESETLELKSTMRKNLHSGKNGKEIELAWLKGIVGFLNTKGGILLIGIDDDGNILGLDADGFENEDKIQLHFKNLISQHIGIEFSKDINLYIKQINTHKIIIIECNKANQPVFLYHKNDEIFYIRSGPASVSLSISQALKYIQIHKF